MCLTFTGDGRDRGKDRRVRQGSLDRGHCPRLLDILAGGAGAAHVPGLQRPDAFVAFRRARDLEQSSRPGLARARPHGHSQRNRAFDEYRDETINRLEEEQREFMEYLERLRQARDRAEFDQFMADRRQPQGGPISPVPSEG